LTAKHEIKALCFLIISKLNENERVKQLSIDIKLLSIVTDKLSLTLATLQSFRHLETTKKYGTQKVRSSSSFHLCLLKVSLPQTQHMIKDLCIFLKAATEWNLPLEKHTKSIKKAFYQVLQVTDWIQADSVLMNCFLNFVQVLSGLDIGRSCLLEEIDKMPLTKSILEKTKALSTKIPHTESNLAMIKNGISTLQKCSKYVEVRVMLKNSKVFQFLENLQPHIHSSRKSTWDEVTKEWLKFFEFLSRFDDTECLTK
jgi:hypothetical protein